jgi:hypothetical protein
MTAAARRQRHRPRRQLEQPLGIIAWPAIAVAIDVDDQEPLGRDADVGAGVLRPPPFDLLGIDGRVVEAMFGEWRLAARGAGEDRVAHLRIVKRSGQQLARHHHGISPSAAIAL